jgi:hypothetical protein
MQLNLNVVQPRFFSRSRSKQGMQQSVQLSAPFGAWAVAATASGKSLRDNDYRKRDEKREYGD